MPDTMTPGLGHNNPPLGEMLAEETSALKQRADELVAAAGRASVTDDDTVNRATTLAKMLKEHAKAVDVAREARKRPFLDAGREVDSYYKGIEAPVVAAATKVVGMIDGYRRELERKAAAERARLEAEARRQREAAEAAERARHEAEAKAAREAEEQARKVRAAEEAARQAGDRAAAEKAARERAEIDRQQAEARAKAAEAEIAERAARDKAEALQKQADETVAAPIVSDYGVKASGRKVWKHEVEDPRALFSYLLKADRARVTESLSEIAGRMVKAGVHEIPGCRVWEDSATVIR